jgi:hypothetical protein
MDRIPAHTIDDAPDASRPLLGSFAASSPTGAPLRFQAQMAHAPAVLASYASLRRAIRIGLGAGWSPDVVTRLQAGTGSGDPKLDALLAVVVSAARTTGKVKDVVWQHARDSGWSDAQLAESFAYLGVVVYTAYFVAFAETELDPALAAVPA